MYFISKSPYKDQCPSFHEVSERLKHLGVFRVLEILNQAFTRHYKMYNLIFSYPDLPVENKLKSLP